MVGRVRSDDTVAEEQDLAREEAERLRWINAHIREASIADLTEEAVVDEEDEDLPPLADR
jgi:hypothetical protein